MDLVIIISKSKTEFFLRKYDIIFTTFEIGVGFTSSSMTNNRTNTRLSIRDNTTVDLFKYIVEIVKIDHSVTIIFLGQEISSIRQTNRGFREEIGGSKTIMIVNRTFSTIHDI